MTCPTLCPSALYTLDPSHQTSYSVPLLLTWLQPCWPLNAPRMFLPQGLCTGCSFCTNHLLPNLSILSPNSNLSIFVPLSPLLNFIFLISIYGHLTLWYIYIFQGRDFESLLFVAKLCLTFCDPMDCSMPGSSVLHCLPGSVLCLVAQSCPPLCDPRDCSPPDSAQFMPIQSVMLSDHLIFCCPFFLLFSIFPSIRVFSNESALHIRWSKYWSFSFSNSPSNEYSGLISFRINWFDFFFLQSKRLSRVFSSTTVQKHQFFGAQPSL